MAANPTLAQLRTLVRQRVRLSANDPNMGDETINRAISMAMGDIAGDRPNGWWFQRYEVTKKNTAGDLAVLPVHLATPDPTRIIQQLSYVWTSADGDYWTRIDQRTRPDAIRAAGGRMVAAGTPGSWGQVRVPVAGGVRNQLGVAFDPPLPNNYWTRIGLVVGPGEFVADTDHLVWLPAQFMGVVIERASTKLSRQRRKVGQLTSRRRYITEVTMDASACDEGLKALRLWWDTPYSGPSYAGRSVVE